MSPSPQSGFTLPFVLLLVGALGGAAVLATLAAQGNARGVAAATGIAQAEALADAGVALALMDLERTRTASPQRGTAQPAPWHHACRMATGALRLASQDEGGKIDLNFADERLLTALLVGVGVPRVQAQALADAMIDFRDADDARRPFGAEADEYRAAGLAHGPKNARLTDIAEIRSVLGMTQEIADRIGPFITVHSSRDGIDPAVADKTLIAILVRGDAEAGGASSPTSEEAPSLGASGETTLPALFVQPSPRRYYTLTADATLPHARFIREAIIESGTPPAAGIGSAPLVAHYRFWSWRRREGAAAIDMRAGSELPPC